MAPGDEQSHAGPERAVLEIPANLWRGSEAVGGRLTVTERRVVFRSHGFNAQIGVTEFPLSDVAQVQPCNSLGIVPNGMRVVLRAGAEYRFVVWGRARVIAAIQAALPAAPGPPNL